MDLAPSTHAAPQRSGTRVGNSVSDACDEPPPALLRKGIEEFNAGRYWECHETLEGLWRAEPRPVRELYQGLLQVGVGFHHLRNGNYSGAVKVLRRGLVRLDGLPDECQGVRVMEIRAAARRVYERILELGPDGVRDLEVGSLPRVECCRHDGRR